MKPGFTYILASQKRGTLYIGLTSNLARRVREHKAGLTGGFTAKYGVKRLVYFEQHGSMRDAIAREAYLKNRRRSFKMDLVEQANPTWRDLYEDIAYDG